MAMTDQLYNMYAPYVHSSVYHFSNGARSLNSRPERKDRLQQVIDKLDSYISDLRTHEGKLYRALNVGDYIGLNNKLFGSTNEQTEQTVVYSILSDTSFIFGLIPRIKQQVAQSVASRLDKTGQLQEAINDDISKGKLRDLLIAHIRQAFSGQKRITVEDFVSTLSDDIQEEVGEALSEYSTAALETKTNSNLYKFVMTALKIADLPMSVDRNVFIDDFARHYVEKMAEYPFGWTGKTLSVQGELGSYERGKNIAEQMFNLFQKGGDLPGSLKNLLGELAERGLVWNTSITETGVDIEISMEQMGKKTEQQVAQRIQEILQSDVPKVMKTLHNINKDEGQTDNLLIVKINGEQLVYRIQSKNKLLAWLQDIEDSMVSARPMQIQFHKTEGNQEVTLLRLMELLKSENYLTEWDCSTISYLMSNVMWFRTHESMMLGNNGVGEVSIDGTMLQTKKDEAEKILSYATGAVLGLGFDNLDGEINGKIDINSSNIFYFLGNRTLLPVSNILEQVKNRLENADSSIYSLHYQVDDTTSFAFSSASQFKEAKKTALEESGYEGKNYENSNLLDIGRKQGQIIMQSLRGHIRSDYDIVNILRTSSYVFGK